jgi:hypothetical protein
VLSLTETSLSWTFPSPRIPDDDGFFALLDVDAEDSW